MAVGSLFWRVLYRRRFLPAGQLENLLERARLFDFEAQRRLLHALASELGYDSAAAGLLAAPLSRFWSAVFEAKDTPVVLRIYFLGLEPNLYFANAVLRLELASELERETDLRGFKRLVRCNAAAQNEILKRGKGCQVPFLLPGV
jgi:hypothetical protein